MRKFTDLSGQKFGQLTVLKRVDNKIDKHGASHVMYECNCDCGNIIVTRATYLRSGHSSSCGCSRKTSLKDVNLEDLSNKYFGRWHVMHRAESVIEPSGRKATVWHCKCQCGTERDVKAGSLKSGQSKSCGCLKIDVLSKYKDLSGEIFGRWTVVSQGDDYVAKNGRHYRRWNCKCSCGTERCVTENALLAGKSVSCGCYRKEQLLKTVEFDDLSGRIFGNWTVVSRVDDKFYECGGRAQMYKCRCICGNENDVARAMLISGMSQSCGCLSAPRSEVLVRQYLDNHNLKYEQQKNYDDLRGIGNGLLSYDFLVYVNDVPYCFIECQGEQHYRPVKYFGGLERFKVQQQHDMLKREYAASKYVDLIEIKYDSRTYDDISKVLDIYF